MRSASSRGFVNTVCFTDGVAEELHLTPQVVVQTPAHEVLDAFLPLAAVGDVQHAGFQPGDDTGAERQVPIHLILRQAGKLRTFLLQLLRQLRSLRTIHKAAGGTEVVDVWLQGFVKRCIILSVNGLLNANLRLWNRAEIDAAYRSVGQYVAEVPLTLLNRRTRVPIEPTARTGCHRLRTDTRLTVLRIGVEGEAHQLEVLLTPSKLPTTTNTTNTKNIPSIILRF